MYVHIHIQALDEVRVLLNDSYAAHDTSDVVRGRRLENISYDCHEPCHISVKNHIISMSRTISYKYHELWPLTGGKVAKLKKFSSAYQLANI